MDGTTFAVALLALGASSLAQSVTRPGTQTIAGRWDATIQINGVETPFPLEISGSGTNVIGYFFNGDDRYASTQGRFENGKLALFWDYYAATLDATLKDGVLEGQYAGTRRMKGPFAIRATRETAAKPIAGSGLVPSIEGAWEIPNKSGKGELAWRFIVQQTGAQQAGIQQPSAKVSATILRVDGDTGTISGTFQNGKFVLSHFDGARAHLLEITPASGGTLDILQDGKTKLTAYRPAAARAKGLPEPTDPNLHTSMKDPREPFRFSFPGPEWASRIQWRRALPRQSRGGRDHGQLVPELSRRSSFSG